MMQLNGGLWQRLFYTAGAGLENNALFGFAGSPRASLAYYLAKPRDQGILSGTRLVFNFGKGVNEPSIYYETNSLYDLLQSLGYPGPIDHRAIQHPSLPMGALAHLRRRRAANIAARQGAPFDHLLPQRIRRSGGVRSPAGTDANLVCSQAVD